MARKRTPTLTDGELKIMEVLWERGEASVREVTGALSTRKQPVAYSTVLTMLRILHDKKQARYRKEGRAFIYSAVVDRNQARAKALIHLLTRFFDNSPTALAQNLLQEEDVDMLELRRLQDKLEAAGRRKKKTKHKEGGR